MHFDAKREGNSLRIPKTKTTQTKLPHTQLVTGSHCSRAENLATQPNGGEMQHLYKPQEFKVHI